MNRRNFISSLLVGGASFNILPGAGRLWVARRDTRLLPFWIQTNRLAMFYTDAYLEAVQKLICKQIDELSGK